MKIEVLDLKVDLITKTEVVNLIKEKIKTGKFFHVVTAYSEFFVAALRDQEFKKIVSEANLVVPDGVGPLAAINFKASLKQKDSIFIKFLKGLKTGWHVFSGQVGEPVSGVWLFTQLLINAAENGWRVFLLGGFGDVSMELKNKLKIVYPHLLVDSDPGEQKLRDYKSSESLERINKFQPDILFVAYGQIKQEKWIYAHKKDLRAKVVVGVGSTFDEMTGKIAAAPKFMEDVGLKWLWRLYREPKRWRRIINAVIVFPWLVFNRAVFQRHFHCH